MAGTVWLARRHVAVSVHPTPPHLSTPSQPSTHLQVSFSFFPLLHMAPDTCAQPNVNILTQELVYASTTTLLGINPLQNLISSFTLPGAGVGCKLVAWKRGSALQLGGDAATGVGRLKGTGGLRYASTTTLLGITSLQKLISSFTLPVGMMTWWALQAGRRVAVLQRAFKCRSSFTTLTIAQVENLPCPCGCSVTYSYKSWVCPVSQVSP